MNHFQVRRSTTISKSFLLKLSLFALGTVLLATGTHAQISGGSNGQPVIATGASTGTTTGLYIDASRFASLSAALTACPSTIGCTIDLRGFSGPVTGIDPGSKSVALLFGPGTYTVTGSFTMRSNFHVRGAGSSDNDGTGTPVGTIIKAAAAGTPPFKLGGGQMVGVDLEGFRVYGSAGISGSDSNPAIDVTAAAGGSSAGGCFNCTFRDLSLLGFNGGSGGVLNFVGGANVGVLVNQFIVVEKVQVYRSAVSGSSGHALNIAGENGQMYFTDCQFDGPGGTDTGTNVYLGVASGTATPYSLSFRGMTSQSAGLAVLIKGGWDIRFEQSHHEALTTGGYNILNSSTVGSYGIVIDSSYFAGNVGAPSGYDVNVGTSLADLIFTHNYISGTPGHVIAGTNGNTVTYSDNNYNNNTFSSVSPVTSGIATQLNPAATLNVGRSHVILLNASATSVQTIVSQLGPGETVTFTSNGGFPGTTFQFATGGNLSLGTNASPLIVKSPDTVTFMRSDLSETYYLVGKSF